MINGCHIGPVIQSNVSRSGLRMVVLAQGEEVYQLHRRINVDATSSTLYIRHLSLWWMNVFFLNTNAFIYGAIFP